MEHPEDKFYDEIVNRLPPGYRFVPEDEELIEKFLKVIIKNPERGRVQGIFIVNLYASPPDELTAAHKPQCEDTWYFFTKRTRKYANGSRPARAAGRGYWKQTNVIDHIFGVDEEKKPAEIGRKITLDYWYKNDKVDWRSDWKMNEYRLDGVNLPDEQRSNAATSKEFDEWSLCRIYKSRGSKQKNKGKQVVLQVEAEPSSGTQPMAPQEHNEHFAGEADGNFTEQSAAAASNNQLSIPREQYNGLFPGQFAGGNSTGQSTAAASSNQLSIPREQYNGLYPGHFAGGNFTGQSTTAASNNQLSNPREQYNGLYAGGPGPSSVLQFNNSGAFPNHSNYMANVASGSMNGMHYTSDGLLPENQYTYFMYENAAYVQPLRSLPPNGIPTWPPSDINQSSSSIPDHITSEEEFDIYFNDLDFITYDDLDLGKKDL